MEKTTLVPVELVPTDEALVAIGAVLDVVDHAQRRGWNSQQRIDQMDQCRMLARRVQALHATLVGEAEQAKAAEEAKRTPLTSLLSCRGNLNRAEASGIVHGGKDLVAHRQVQLAALAGQIDIKHARCIAKMMKELPEGLDSQQREAAEGLLVEAARKVPSDKLPKLVDSVIHQIAPEKLPTAKDREAYLEARRRRAMQRRSLIFYSDHQGSTLFKGSLPDAEASVFVKMIDGYLGALARERRENRRAADQLDRFTAEASMDQRRADALMRLVNNHHQALGARQIPDPELPDEDLEDSASSGQQSQSMGSDKVRLSGVVPSGAGISFAGTYEETLSMSGWSRQFTLPRPTADPPRVVVFLHYQDLAEKAENAGLLDTGQTLSVGELRRLCCDAEILPIVLGGSSEILDVGRSQRLVTPELYRALVMRDGGCAFPGCTVPASRCEAHHVVPWFLGGRTCLRNLVLLCPHHHGVIEPPRLGINASTSSGSAPTDRWEVRIGAQGLPEFLPPARIDPQREPILHKPVWAR